MLSFFFSVIFYDCLLLDLCFFFCFHIFMTLDSSLNNKEPVLTFLLYFCLIIKLCHYYYGSIILYHIVLYYIKLYYITLYYIILYYINALHYSRLFHLIISYIIYYLFSIFLLLFFYCHFPFQSPVSFTFIFQTLFGLALL